MKPSCLIAAASFLGLFACHTPTALPAPALTIEVDLGVIGVGGNSATISWWFLDAARRVTGQWTLTDSTVACFAVTVPQWGDSAGFSAALVATSSGAPVVYRATESFTMATWQNWVVWDGQPFVYARPPNEPCRH